MCDSTKAENLKLAMMIWIHYNHVNYFQLVEILIDLEAGCRDASSLPSHQVPASVLVAVFVDLTNASAFSA